MSQPLNHAVHTQEGKNRFKPKTDQLELIGPTAEEEALVALYRKLQFFPTPAWPIRAVIDQLRQEGHPAGDAGSALDPCAGQGHMTRVLTELGFMVDAADIHDFGHGFRIEDFLKANYGRRQYDLVMMNPPFSLDVDPRNAPTIADRFIAKALTLAPDVLVFGRLAFLTPGIRFELMNTKLDMIYAFCERPSCALGRITEKSGATDHVFFHFRRDRDAHSDRPPVHLFGPGTRDRFTRLGGGA